MDVTLAKIRKQAMAGEIRITQHALAEMEDEDIVLDEVLMAIANGLILEDYPEHKRGSCCLLYGYTFSERHLHIVCTTALPVLLIITVYEPLLPKWITPTQRRTL